MNLRLCGKNTIIYGLGTICLRASAFLLIPLYTHALSVEDYGLFSTLLLTIQIMIILMSVGMRTSLLRFAKEYEDGKIMGALMGSSLALNAVVGVIIIGITLFFLQPFFRSILHVDQIGEYLALTGVAALVQTLCLHLMSYYQAKNEALRFSLVGISAAILLLVSNAVFLMIFHLGLRGALVANIVTYCAVFVFVWIDVLIKKTGFTLSMAVVPKLIRFGFPLVFSMLGQVLVGSASIYFLSYSEGLEVVAVFSLGYKLAMVAGMVLTLPFQLAYQPLVFENIENLELKAKMARTFTYFYVAMAIISIVILLASRVLLPYIAPPEYASAYLVIILMLPTVASNGLVIFGETLLSIVKKTHIVGTAAGLGGIASLWFNYMLVPAMGWYGAVIASNISCLLTGLIIFGLGMKAFSMRLEWLRTGFSVGVFAAFLLIAFVLHPASNVIFCGGLAAATVMIASLVKVWNVCDERELTAIRSLLQGIKVKFKPYPAIQNGK